MRSPKIANGHRGNTETSKIPEALGKEKRVEVGESQRIERIKGEGPGRKRSETTDLWRQRCE